MPKIFNVSDIKSTDFIPQIAILTPFRKLTPASAHFVKFGIKPEKMMYV